MTSLTTLDVSDNKIRSFEGLRGHAAITTLIASGNAVADVSVIEPLDGCASLVTIDLSKNKLSGAECADFFLEKFADRAKLLKLQGNPVVSEVPSYRKKMVSGLRALRRVLVVTPVPIRPRPRCERRSSRTGSRPPASRVSPPRVPRIQSRRARRDAFQSPPSTPFNAT